MRAKKLGRHEMLNWVNTITQSDYPKIENLSDGVAYCQLLDAFYPNLVSLNSLRLNSKNPEDWEKNLGLVNELLLKAKSKKQIDPTKLSKSKFTQNFEFLQFLYDYFAKNFGEPLTRYQALEKRLEILKSQFGSKMTDVKKFLPTHLIPNELILKMDRQKFFGNSNENVNMNMLKSNYNTTSGKNLNRINLNEIEIKEGEGYNTNYGSNFYSGSERNTPSLSSNVKVMADKYKDFFVILKDDLKKMMESNANLSTEIKEIEEERCYYLDKINNVKKFCESKINSEKINLETSKKLENIIKIIKQ